MKGRRKNGE